MSRFNTEQHFRRYEEYFAAIVKSWPGMCQFKPQPPILSCETLVSHLRLARQALLNHVQHDLQSTPWKLSFRLDVFMQIADDITFSTATLPGMVVAGPYEVLRRHTAKPALSTLIEDDKPTTTPIIDLPPETDPKVVHAVLLLHHHKILIEPSKLRHPLTKEMADSYDVACIQESDHYVIL